MRKWNILQMILPKAHEFSDANTRRAAKISQPEGMKTKNTCKKVVLNSRRPAQGSRIESRFIVPGFVQRGYCGVRQRRYGRQPYGNRKNFRNSRYKSADGTVFSSIPRIMQVYAVVFIGGLTNRATCVLLVRKKGMTHLQRPHGQENEQE